MSSGPGDGTDCCVRCDKEIRAGFIHCKDCEPGSGNRRGAGRPAVLRSSVRGVFYIEKEQSEALEAEAAAAGTNTSAVVRDILRKHFRRKR